MNTDTINILGAGRVGKSLAKALSMSGWKIRIIANRTMKSSTEAVKFIGAGKAVTIDSQQSPKGILLVCIPDDALKNLGVILKNWELENLSSIIHTSGAISSKIFDLILNLPKDVGKATLHPVKAFADPSKSFKDLKGVYFGIEGNPKGVHDALKIVKTLGGIPIEITSEQKFLYHLSAVFSSNFLVELFWIARLLQSKCGIPDSISKDMILKLMRGTIENLSKLSLQKALTGPVARGDWELIEKEHLTLNKTFPEFVAFFDEGIKLLERLSGGMYNGYKQDNPI